MQQYFINSKLLLLFISQKLASPHRTEDESSQSKRLRLPSDSTTEYSKVPINNF